MLSRFESVCPAGASRIEVTPILQFPRDARGRVDAEAANVMVHGIVEEWIREYPDQWLWLHERWRDRPPARPAGGACASRLTRGNVHVMSSLIGIVPPVDGRQSAHAAAVQRGVGRLLRLQGFAMVTELPLATGRRADVVGLSGHGEIWIVEIKSSSRGFPQRSQMAGIPPLLRPALLRHPRRRAGRHLSQ